MSDSASFESTSDLPHVTPLALPLVSFLRVTIGVARSEYHEADKKDDIAAYSHLFSPRVITLISLLLMQVDDQYTFLNFGIKILPFLIR